MAHYKYIYEEKEFSKYYDVVKECFLIDENLPNQVFKNNYSYYIFEEFDWLMTGEGWLDIKKIAKITNDESIIFGVLDPKPITYYYKEFGYYNWLVMSTEMSDSDYYEALEIAPPASMADAICYNSRVIVLVPTSKKWVIWGDRSCGTCILGLNRNNLDKETSLIANKWKRIDDVIKWMSFYLINNKNGKNIYRIFKDNYDWLSK